MSKLRKLQDRLAAIKQAMADINNKAQEEERPFTEAEQKSWDSHEAEAKEVAAAIEREKRLQEIERDLIPQSFDPDDPPEGHIPQKKTPKDGKASWKSFGEMLQAVVNFAKDPRDLDPRLESPQAATGLSESVSSEGGFLVQTDFATDLLARMYDNNQILNGGAGYAGCQKIRVSERSNGVKIPGVNETSRADGSRWGGVQAYWKAEAAQKTASKPDFREIDLSLKKLIGLCYATDELLQDAMALESVITQAFGEEFAFKVQDSLVNGLGTGMPLGILESNCLVSVAKESSQTATTINAANIAKMYSRMWARGLNRAVWHINQDCWPQMLLLNTIADGSGQPLFLAPGAMPNQPNATLLGRPIVPIEQCQTLGALGDIYFCDWSQFLFCDKGNMQQASSIHVKFDYDETCFRFVYRCDGQPAWNSALTPFKGSNTQSPFVALALRG